MDMEQDQKPLPVGITQEEMDRVNKTMKRVADARLPGETRGWSIFRITFDDGCQNIRHTSNVIAWKVEQLCDPEDPSSDPWLVTHDQAMGKTLECLASGLRKGQALAGRNRMVAASREEEEARTQDSEKKTCTISELLHNQRPGMMHRCHQILRARTRTEQRQDFGPEHFAGWPATVPTERLERAIQYVRDRTSIEPNIHDLPVSGDPNLDMDVFLTAHSMISPHHIANVDLTPLDTVSEINFMVVFWQILQDLETDHHFPCAIIDVVADQHHPSTNRVFTDIFTLAKHPEWMGLSTSLPNIRNHHVTSLESREHPLSPSVMFAVPDVMMPKPIAQPLTAPQGGLQTLADIAAWHGAASFNGFPADPRP